jgi:hypothetical protein
MLLLLLLLPHMQGFLIGHAPCEVSFLLKVASRARRLWMMLGEVTAEALTQPDTFFEWFLASLVGFDSSCFRASGESCLPNRCPSSAQPELVVSRAVHLERGQYENNRSVQSVANLVGSGALC